MMRRGIKGFILTLTTLGILLIGYVVYAYMTEYYLPVLKNPEKQYMIQEVQDLVNRYTKIYTIENIEKAINESNKCNIRDFKDMFYSQIYSIEYVCKNTKITLNHRAGDPQKLFGRYKFSQTYGDTIDETFTLLAIFDYYEKEFNPTAWKYGYEVYIAYIKAKNETGEYYIMIPLIGCEAHPFYTQGEECVLRPLWKYAILETVTDNSEVLGRIFDTLKAKYNVSIDDYVIVKYWKDRNGYHYEGEVNIKPRKWYGDIGEVRNFVNDTIKDIDKTIYKKWNK